MDIGFKDIKEIVDRGITEGGGFRSLRSDEGDFQTLKIGAGDQSFKVDRQGLWLGADQFEDAPFRIYINGNIYMQAASGSGYLLIDAENSRIIVNDGTNDRVLMGYDSGGF